MSTQLWQEMRLASLDQMIGNTTALVELKGISSGFILIEGPMGCGKTSAALAYAAAQTGVRIRESESRYIAAQHRYVAHCHATDLEIDLLTWRDPMGFWTPGIRIIDEAQELTQKRQQSKLKSIPLQGDLCLILCTTNPEKLDQSLRDRCQKVRLGPLNPKEVRTLVERACQHRSIHYSDEIVRQLNLAECFRPRQILNTIDDLSRGKPLLQAVGDNK
jgi:DNA polymerase III delta prime subunit